MPCGSGVLWRNVEPNEDVGNFRGGDCDSLDYMDWIGGVCATLVDVTSNFL